MTVRTTFLVAALSSAVIAAPAFAQSTTGQTTTDQTTTGQTTTGQTTTGQTNQTITTMQENQRGQTAQYVGWPVYTSDGQEVGKVVSASAKNQTGATTGSSTGSQTGTQSQSSTQSQMGTQAQAGAMGDKLHVDMSGFLGIGSRTVALEEDQYTVGDNRINLTVSADEARNLPEAPAQ